MNRMKDKINGLNSYNIDLNDIYNDMDNEPIEEPVNDEPISKIIKDKPVPKGVCEDVIRGISVDFHDLENFVVSVSPTKFVNLLKLNYQRAREYKLRHVDDKKMNSSTIILILAVLGMGALGVVMLLFMPDIINMFNGGV